MELAAAERVYDEIHKAEPWHDGTFMTWTPRRTAATPYHYRDGVDLYVAATDVNPDDRFLDGPGSPATSQPD